jgi:phage-related protein
MESSGFSWEGSGKLPTPIITIVNVDNAYSTLNNLYEDFSGVQVTRKITFESFLDFNTDGTSNPDADGTAHLPIERYRIDRKTSENELLVSYQLVASIDNEGQKIPHRQFVKDYCPLVYRVYDAEGSSILPPGSSLSSYFDYTNASCPWTGGYFNEQNQSVSNPSEDICNHRLSGCQVRFGLVFEPLPFGGFPSLANIPT